MLFIFEETETGAREEYKFGGRLTIKAEGIDDSARLVDHFKLHKGEDLESLQARIDALGRPDISHTIGTDKRPVYEVDSCLPYEFSKPYADWMEKTLGYVGPLPDIAIPMQWHGLQFTNYKAELRLQGEHITFRAYTTSEPWDGKDAQTYAESRIVDTIGEEFGTRYHEPEMIEYRSGQFKRNPNYLKRHPAKPSASNAGLKRALFAWWLDTQATEEQREIVEGNAGIVAETGDYMSAFNFERYESNIFYGHKKTEDGKNREYLAMSFTDFAAMSQPVTV